MLNYCGDLEELSSNLYLLTNLCRLEFIETNVRKVPPHLGKLKNLKVVMNSFNVGELQNIENSLDALEADLKNKTQRSGWDGVGIEILLVQKKKRT